MAILGAASFSLVPLALEMLVDFTYPEVGAEASSSLAWASGQIGGGVWIVVMDALGEGGDGNGTRNSGALVWQACWACAVVPIPMFLGWWGTGRRKRMEIQDEEEEGEFRAGMG